MTSEPPVDSEPRPSETMGRAVAGVVGVTLCAKLLGFVEKQVVAYYFGVSGVVDAFVVALSVPIAIFLLVRELVEPTFLPLFVRHLDAKRLARSGALFVGVAVGILGLLIWWARE